MKIVIIFACVYLAAGAPAIDKGGLQNDIHDFLEVIPLEKIKKIAIQHLHDDQEFKAAVKYMKSPEWVATVTELMKQHEVIEFLKIFKESGIDITEFGRKVCGFFKDVKVETDHPVKSLKGFIEDVKQIIPLAKLIQMFDDKMTNSTAFKALYDRITSEETHQIVTKVRALPQFQKVVADLKSMDVDINRILTIIYAVFGWTDAPAVTTPNHSV